MSCCCFFGIQPDGAGRKAAYLSGAVFVVMLAVWAANLFSHVHRFGAP